MSNTKDNVPTVFGGESQGNRKAEGGHKGLFDTGASEMEKGEAVDKKAIYVCEVCGYRVEGEAPERCPTCRAPKRMFKLIE
jgi:rubrerythrin